MVPDDIGLCSLTDVRELMGTPATDTRRDARVTDLIIRASAMVMAFTQREFAPGGAAMLSPEGARDLILPDRDTGVIVAPLAGWDIDKLAEIDVVALSEDPDVDPVIVRAMMVGRNGEPVYHTIRTNMPSTHTYALRITASLWGWPSVLPDVQEATAMTVAHLMTAFPAAGRPDPMAEPRMFEPRGMPRTAYDMLARYRVGAQPGDLSARRGRA